MPYLNERRDIVELDRKLIKGFYRRVLNDYKALGSEKDDSSDSCSSYGSQDTQKIKQS